GRRLPTNEGRRPGPAQVPAPQHRLYFLPLPHGHGSLRPTRWVTRRCPTVAAAAPPAPGRRAAEAAAMPIPPAAAPPAAAAAPRTLPPLRPSIAASLVVALRSRSRRPAPRGRRPSRPPSVTTRLPNRP